MPTETLNEVLADIEEYLRERADAEYFPDRAAPVPNEEMVLLVRLREAHTQSGTQPTATGAGVPRVLALCHKCHQEFSVPLESGGNATTDLLCNFCDCPHCNTRNDLWIKLTTQPTGGEWVRVRLETAAIVMEALEFYARERFRGFGDDPEPIEHHWAQEAMAEIRPLLPQPPQDREGDDPDGYESAHDLRLQAEALSKIALRLKLSKEFATPAYKAGMRIAHEAIAEEAKRLRDQVDELEKKAWK